MAKEGIRQRPRAGGGTSFQAVWRDAAGKQRTKTFRSEREAVAFRNERLVEARQGVVPADAKMTFATLCQRFLEVYAPPKQATWLLREKAIRLHLIPAFGAMKLAAIDGQVIDRWFARVRREPTVCHGRPSATPRAKQIASAETVRSWGATLQIVLGQAVKWRLIPRNPYDDATPPPLPEKTVPPHWGEAEAATFFAHDPDHVDWPLWVVLATCQLRISEALALRWSDVDWGAGVLRIERGLSRTKGERFAEASPKTRSSRRAITLPAETLEALKLHQERQNERRRLLGGLWRGHVPGWIFDNGEGVRLHQESARLRFERAMVAAGVPRIHFHGLRHTGATSMARAGMSSKVLALRLGHSSSQITEQVYAHFKPEDQAPHADAFAGRIIAGRATG